MRKTLLVFLFICICINILANEDWWYKAQTGTGLGNCGSATVAMSIYWSTGIDISFETVRSTIGYKLWDSATSYDELYNSLIEYDINAYFEEILSLEKLISIVFNYNKIVIALIDASKIEVIDGDYYGKTHYYEGGHYIILYDYFADTFQVHDPLIYGENRLYKMMQVWNAIKENRVIVIQK